MSENKIVVRKKPTGNNIVTIDGINYTKDKTAFVVGGEWVAKKNLETNTFTNTLELKKKLTSYKDMSGEIKYTSDPIKIITQNRVITGCKSMLKTYNDLVLHPGSGDGAYTSVNETGIHRDYKFSPREKIYNYKDYGRKVTTPEKIENNLSFLKGLTYGFEIETSEGFIHDNNSNALGFANLYDGSITGAEYTSCILTYDNLHTVDKFLDLAKMATKFNDQCSLHIHIGGIKYTDKTLLSTYVLYQRLQDEINQLIAPYKKNFNFLAKKNKDHCADLPKLINKTTKEIYSLFEIGDYYGERGDLAGYLGNRNKWTIYGRYYTVNFMNFICNGTTIEARALQTTYSFDYAMTWLLINSAIIKYAEANYDKIVDGREKIELQDTLTWLIKDEKLLETVLFNIREIKNYFYNAKYKAKDLLFNIYEVDKDLGRNLKSLKIYAKEPKVVTTNFTRDYKAVAMGSNESPRVASHHDTWSIEEGDDEGDFFIDDDGNKVFKRDPLRKVTAVDSVHYIRNIGGSANDFLPDRLPDVTKIYPMGSGAYRSISGDRFPLPSGYFIARNGRISYNISIPGMNTDIVKPKPSFGTGSFKPSYSYITGDISNESVHNTEKQKMSFSDYIKMSTQEEMMRDIEKEQSRELNKK